MGSKKTDGSTMQWIIDMASTDTRSPFLPCKATGKKKAKGKADIEINRTSSGQPL
ncbi:MAG: hypothetical protein WCQ99_12975 [Pseudomonadota bacterium]